MRLLYLDNYGMPCLEKFSDDKIPLYAYTSPGLHTNLTNGLTALWDLMFKHFLKTTVRTQSKWKVEGSN